MKVANIILDQLGGSRFIVMTGSKNFVSDNNTLRMTLAKNKSKANRLYITLDPDDTYTVHFFRYIPEKLVISEKKGTAEIRPEKKTDIKLLHGIYCDQLEEIFTEVTGLYTRL